MNRKNPAIAFLGIILILVIGSVFWFTQQEPPESNQDAVLPLITNQENSEQENNSQDIEPTESADKSDTESTPETEENNAAADESQSEPNSIKELRTKPLTYALEGYITNENGQAVNQSELIVQKITSYYPVGIGGSGNPAVSKWEEVARVVSDTDGYYFIPIDFDLPVNIILVKENLGNEVFGIYHGDLKISRVDEDYLYVRNDFTLSSKPEFEMTVVNQENESIENVKIDSIRFLKAPSGFRRQAHKVEYETKEDGTFLLQTVSNEDQVILILDKAGYASKRITVSIPPEENTIELQSGGAVVEGTVVIGNDENPLSDALVELYQTKPVNTSNPDPLGFSTTTDENGMFRFENLSADMYEAIAYRHSDKTQKHNQFMNKEFTLGEHEVRDDIVIVLPDESPTWEIKVVEQDTEKPIKGAQLLSHSFLDLPRAIKNITTDEDGIFDLSGITYTDDQFFDYIEYAKVSAPGFASEQLFPRDYTTKIPLIENKSVSVELAVSEYIKLSGTVTDYEGRPVKNALVTVARENLRSDDQAAAEDLTDEKGRYALEVLARSEPILSFDHADYPDNNSEQISVENEDQIYHHQMDSGGHIKILILDPDKVPVPECDLTIAYDIRGSSFSTAREWINGTTDQNGEYLSPVLPSLNSPLPPDYDKASIRIMIRNDDYESLTYKDAEVIENEVFEVEINLEEKDTSGYIDGYAKDESGNPIEGAKITLWSSTYGIHKTTVTDALGFFALENIKATEYDLNLRHPEYNYYSKEVELPISDYELIVGKREVE